MSTKSSEKTEHNEMNDKKEHKSHKGPQDHKEKPLLDHAAYEELMTQLNEAEQKNAQYWDRILRMQADSENASRRAERDIANAHKFALEKFLTDLLPVIDNLEKAVSTSEETTSEALPIIEGVNLTLKMLYDVLEKVAVKQVNPINESFNPAFHEAISMQEDASCKPGTVIAVLRKGYLLNERLIRPALVIVSKQ